jgi:predicted transposase/invertase (TIGR01784 family)
VKTAKKKVSKKDNKIRIYTSYDELDISDDFMFSKIMRDPIHRKPMLETILGKKIARIDYPETQKTIDLAADAKSVRLDVYRTDDEHTVYQIEMQVRGTPDIPKRIRYSQGMIDLNLIEKGQTYSALNKTIIIFICKEDIFKKNRCVYTFENICVEDPALRLGDETTKIYLYTDGDAKGIDAELKAFLDYVGGREPKMDYAKILDSAVKKARENVEWRREFMTLI